MLLLPNCVGIYLLFIGCPFWSLTLYWLPSHTVCMCMLYSMSHYMIWGKLMDELCLLGSIKFFKTKTKSSAVMRSHEQSSLVSKYVGRFTPWSSVIQYSNRLTLTVCQVHIWSHLIDLWSRQAVWYFDANGSTQEIWTCLIRRCAQCREQLGAPGC